MTPSICASARVAHRITLLIILAVLPARLNGQGITTAAIEGRITDGIGRPLEEAEVTVTHQATGGSTRGRAQENGRYLISGLEVGGPYSVSVRHIGQAMQTRARIYLQLGQRLRLDFQLDQRPATLTAIETRAPHTRVFSRTRTGMETFIDDSTIHRMPIVNRDMYDLLRLVPQVATWNTLSASGMSPRLNSIRIDGVSDQTIFGAVPAGSVLGGRSISLDAVQEYQVLLSPSDVRYGGFAGATIIGVTRRGTNELRGGAFVYGTNERLGPNVPFIRDARYSKTQFGVLLGGPIVRDRLHFFVATELQQRRIPALGPYLGQGAGSETPMPVMPADVHRFQNILADYALDGGTGGVIVNPNPASNVFVRFDAPLGRWNSRVVLLGNYSSADTALFARPTPPPNSNCTTALCFPLSSLQQRWAFDKRSLAAQVYSSFAAADNELIVGHLVTPSSIGASVRQPLILVHTIGPDGEPVVLQSGSHENATADSTVNWNTELIDNLTVTRGRHRITIGSTNSFFRVRRFDLRAAYGVWEFASLDSFATGVASSYRVRRNTGAALASIVGNQHALYVGDEWDLSQRLLITLGLRADVGFIRGRPPLVPAVDSLFDHRTDDFPTGRVQWSPRLGFNYSRGDGAQLTQIRGGIGVFSGRPAGAWLFAPFANYGAGNPTLRCGAGVTDAGPPPAFRADHRDPPSTCANGQGIATSASDEVDLVDANFRFPQVMRVSLATDRHLALGLIGTLEGLYTRAAWNPLFTPVNLAGPIGRDRHGRVMYGTVATTGIATPNRVTARFGDVVKMGNHSKDYSWDVTARIEKTFAQRGDLHVSLTHGRARDVQSHRAVRPVLLDNWRYGRTVSGRQDDLATGVSDFDQPFRLRANGRLLSPWRRWGTDLSFYYMGGSGLPYSYVAGGAVRGDLNADGAMGNDPIYLPRTAGDTAEIQFAGTAPEVAAQQAAFDAFIDGEACLRRQRGRIMARNSCRTPWINLLNAAVRQSVPSSRGQLVVELQLFNGLNLLNSRWGRVQLPSLAMPTATTQVPLLSQVGQTMGALEDAQPIYRFDTAARRYSALNFESFYQIQLAVRYDF